MPDHSTIQVRFFDATTGQPIGEAELPVGNLPQSFEAATTLRLGEKTYEIVSAFPKTAQEFRATGQLRLDMREMKPVTMNPRDILYSLPTISNELPDIEEGSTKLGKRVLELHEDDWRQIELVALTLESSIEADLRAVARIHQKHRKKPGFDELHVRKEVPSPLEGTWITLSELRSSLGETASWFDGVSFQGVAGLVAGGFAVKLPSGLTVYGLERGGRVHVLALRPPEGVAGASAEGDIRLLAALATRNQLCLVDWCRVDQFPPTAAHFQEWLSGRA
jgi:hypothetical protein